MTDWSSALASAFQQHIEIEWFQWFRWFAREKRYAVQRHPGQECSGSDRLRSESAHHSRSPEDHCNHHAFGDGSQPERTRR